MSVILVQKLRKKRYYIEQLQSTLNSSIPNRTNKEYYIDNKDKKIQYQKEYNTLNKDEIVEYQKNYYIQNKDKLLEYQNKYNVDNKDKILERNF